jgi:uncharacterized membrane protein
MLNLVKKYLEVNNYIDQKELFEEAFLSHPNYPSLFAITDSLSYLLIENLAVKIPKEQFVELPNSFMAIFKGDLVLVKKGASSILVENEQGKKLSLPFEEFLKDWNQVIVVIEPNSKSNNNQLNNTYSKWLLYLLPAILLILLSVFFNNFSFISLILFGTTILGLVLSVLILQEKFGIKTELGSKLCNIGNNVSCDSVIKSNTGIIFKGVTFHDLPILFFGVNFLAILLNHDSSSYIISTLSIVSIPFLFYSIWLQRMKIKKWCFLCLSVSFVIVIQGSVFFLVKKPFSEIELSSIISYSLASTLIITSWYFLKPLLENNEKIKVELNSHKRFKRNFKVFASFLKEIESNEVFESLSGIKLGASDANVKITLFLSPSCGHCHQAFSDAKKIYEKHSDKISLEIFFNVNPENLENEYLPVVETLLVLNSTDEEIALEALNDWHIKKMSLKNWKEKWPLLANNMLVNNQIKKQYEWCIANNFNYTPVKIVNNKLFPNEYELSDLNYFINEFSELKKDTEEDVNLKIV